MEVDTRFAETMNSVGLLYQSLSDSQQQTDLIESLKDLVNKFKPVDLDNLRFPEHIITKGRPKNTKGGRLPSAFEVAERQVKQQALEKKKAAKNDSESHNSDTLRIPKKRSRAVKADPDSLWPQRKSYQQEMTEPLPE